MALHHAVAALPASAKELKPPCAQTICPSLFLTQPVNVSAGGGVTVPPPLFPPVLPLPPEFPPPVGGVTVLPPPVLGGLGFEVLPLPEFPPPTGACGACGVG